MRCTHCGNIRLVKNGNYKGVPRFRRKTYNRFFSNKIRKLTYTDKTNFMALYLNNTGIRKASQFIGCSHSQGIKWIREFANTFRQNLQTAIETLPQRISICYKNGWYIHSGTNL